MATCYLVLCVFAGVQLLRTVIHRHKTRSFRFGFLLVCWLWTALRVFFWFILKLSKSPTWFWHLIYQLPSQSHALPHATCVRCLNFSLRCFPDTHKHP
jgi:hypothetical protein